MRIVMVFGHYGGSPIIQKGGVGRERIPLGSHSYALGNAFFLGPLILGGHPFQGKLLTL